MQVHWFSCPEALWHALQTRELNTVHYSHSTHEAEDGRATLLVASLAHVWPLMV